MSYPELTRNLRINPPEALTVAPGQPIPPIENVEIYGGGFDIRPTNLSPSEIRVAVLGAAGLTTDETATIIRRGSPTVKSQRANLALKLCVSRFTGIVGRCFEDDIFTNVTPPSTSMFSLTIRELEVLDLAGQDHTKAKIAETLFISEHTVKTYTDRVMRKTGAANVPESLLIAHMSGFLPRGPVPD